MSTGFNAFIREMQNRFGMSFEEAVKEGNRRSQAVLRAKRLARERKANLGKLRPHARAKDPFDGVESPRDNG